MYLCKVQYSFERPYMSKKTMIDTVLKYEDEPEEGEHGHAWAGQDNPAQTGHDTDNMTPRRTTRHGQTQTTQHHNDIMGIGSDESEVGSKVMGMKVVGMLREDPGGGGGGGARGREEGKGKRGKEGD